MKGKLRKICTLLLTLTLLFSAFSCVGTCNIGAPNTENNNENSNNEDNNNTNDDNNADNNNNENNGNDDSSGNGENVGDIRLEEGETSITVIVGAEGYNDVLPLWKAYEGDMEIPVSYTSANEAIAKVQDGKIVGVSRGETEVTVSAGKENRKISVMVFEKINNLDFANKTHVRHFGRNYVTDGKMRIANTASGFEVNFVGTQLKATMNRYDVTQGHDYDGTFKVFVDGEFSKYIHSSSLVGTPISLAEGLPQGKHTVSFRKMTEQGYMRTEMSALTTDGFFFSANKEKDLKFEFYGDSITSGYGNLGLNSGYKVDEDGLNTYATMLADYFDAEASVISWCGVPACLDTSGSTFKITDMYDKVDYIDKAPYDFSSEEVDLIVISLGTNDANDSNRTVERMRDGYANVLRLMREKRPNVPIVCIYGMMGRDPIIEEGIKEAVALVAEENIYYLPVETDMSGRDRHPVIDIGHKAVADKLRYYIVGRELV